MEAYSQRMAVSRERLEKLESAWVAIAEVIGEIERELQVIEHREVKLFPQINRYAPIPIPAETAAYEAGL